MGLQRDIQYDLAVQPLAAMTQFEIDTEATVYSAEVDTLGFDAMTMALATDRAINSADASLYTFQESSVSGSGFVDVPDDAVLPFRKNPTNTLTIIPGDYIQTCGVFSTARYVRLSLTVTADTAALNVTPTAILKSQQSEFTGYDPATVPDDGQP